MRFFGVNLDRASPNRNDLRRKVFLSLAALSALAGDALIIIALLDGLLTVPLAVVVHTILALAVVAMVLYWLAERSTALLLGLWVTLLGPLGTLVGWAALSFLARPSARSLEDEDWYQRLRGAEKTGDELVTALRDDRAYQSQSVRLHSFRKIMESGTVGQKQTILGLIAQSYEPALFGFLMEALRSPEVAVRASAAAVFARLRDKQTADLRTAADLAESTDPNDVLEAATRFAAAAASRLLSERESEEARQRALALRRKVARSAVVPLTVGQFDRRLKEGVVLDPAGSVRALADRMPRHASPLRRTESQS